MAIHQDHIASAKNYFQSTCISSKFQLASFPLLGNGGSAVVVKAVRRSDQAMVAIKVVGIIPQPAWSKTPASVYAGNELTVFEKLQNKRHVNVIQCWETIVDQQFDCTSFVMELCDGGTLLFLCEEAAKGRLISEGEVTDIGYQLLSALAWLHANEVIHYDIKPENILIQDQIIKLADFGVAKIWAPTCNGTQGYLPGEVGQLEIAQRRQKQEAVDIYAAAVVLNEVATGRNPACNTSIYDLAVLENNRLETLELIASAPNISSSFHAHLCRMLAANADDRGRARDYIKSHNSSLSLPKLASPQDLNRIRFPMTTINNLQQLPSSRQLVFPPLTYSSTPPAKFSIPLPQCSSSITPAHARFLELKSVNSASARPGFSQNHLPTFDKVAHHHLTPALSLPAPPRSTVLDRVRDPNHRLDLLIDQSAFKRLQMSKEDFQRPYGLRLLKDIGWRIEQAPDIFGRFGGDNSAFLSLIGTKTRLKQALRYLCVEGTLAHTSKSKHGGRESRVGVYILLHNQEELKVLGDVVNYPLRGFSGLCPPEDGGIPGEGQQIMEIRGKTTAAVDMLLNAVNLLLNTRTGHTENQSVTMSNVFKPIMETFEVYRGRKYCDWQPSCRPFAFVPESPPFG